ncbi:tetratricopeptide repeat protein [Streptomyces sp. NPDC001595]|uniref:tetratricopeptide repeat protein n=1 Tax=Streptomyces sp. NPDC001532 TaxID=3154520 RepID=UPI003319EBB4
MSNEGPRFSLVIASQCSALGPRLALERLSEAATELDSVLRDPLRGGSRPALADGRTLLLDEGRTATYEAVAEAVTTAGRAGGLLLLAWIGHGIDAGGDFYVLPEGCTPRPGHPNGPYGIVQHLRELLGGQPGVELVLLLDACMSGAGVTEAAARWTGLNADLRRRIQVLSAANVGDDAYDCAFTRGATELIRDGHIALGERLRADDLKRAAERFERRQQPAMLTLDGAKGGSGLWVARNAALVGRAGSLPALSRADLPALREALRHFRPVPALTEVVDASAEHRFVVVSGPAGHGKTTLLAALTRREVTGGRVPERFVHGLRLLKQQETGDRTARDLAQQLGVTVPGFTAAAEHHEASVARDEWERMPLTERLLLGPLGLLPPGTVVRLVLDGFDQLADSAAAEIRELVERLRALPDGGADVRVIVSARPGVGPAGADRTVELAAAPDEEVRRSLAEQEVPEHLREAIVRAAGGSWLVASLLADHVRGDPHLSAEEVPQGLGAVYDRVLDGALDGGGTWDAPGSPVRAAFTVLAAAGTGAVLPRELLHAACRELGAEEPGDLPAPLRRYVVQAPAGEGGTETRLLGLFHQSLVDHLTGGADATAYAVDVTEGHRALAAALARLAPADRYTPATANEPLHDYARRAEPGHLWRSGAHVAAVERLAERPSPVPADNLAQWRYWYEVVREAYGEDDALATTTQYNLAHYTLMTGDVQGAVELYSSLRPPEGDDLLSMTAQANLAAAEGAGGEARRALQRCTALLPEIEQALGPEHRLTLAVRSNIARWTAHSGDVRTALELAEALLPDRLRILGPDDRETLVTRHHIAQWRAELGDVSGAQRLFTELLDDRLRLLGPDHQETLLSRNSVAVAALTRGDTATAHDLLQDLLEDRRRLLGPDHPEALITRGNLITCIGLRGETERALEMSVELAADWERTRGPEHPYTLRTWCDIIHMMDRLDRTREAAAQLEKLRPALDRVLGPDHPITLMARRLDAGMTERLGRVERALELYDAVVKDGCRALGRTHPETLQARLLQALSTARAGRPQQALRRLIALLPDVLQVHGPDHRDTFTVRLSIAGLTARRDPRRGAELGSALLKDQIRVLGLTHPDTLTTGRFLKATAARRNR